MSSQSGIEWTDATWNPIAGCTRVSPGCDLCYAAQLVATRLKHTRQYGGLAVITKSGRPAFTGEIRLLPERLTEPLRWRKPRRVFVNSMSDLFHEDIPDEYIDRVFAVMALAKGHVFQVLTKRPERMRDYVTRTGRSIELLERPAREMGWSLKFEGYGLVPWPLPNVWLGTSTEDQERADERIPLLLETPAAVRFLSCEPLLGPIRFPLPSKGSVFWSGIHWCIVGGESGPNARPMDIQWARDIVRQCQAAGVSVFVKQLGRYPVSNQDEGPAWGRLYEDAFGKKPTDEWGLRHNPGWKGGNMKQWPADLRVRQWPA